MKKPGFSTAIARSFTEAGTIDDGGIGEGGAELEVAGVDGNGGGGGGFFGLVSSFERRLHRLGELVGCDVSLSMVGF